MKTASFLLALASAHGAVSSIFQRAECNADNCLRGLRATDVAEPALTSRQYDCAVYMTSFIMPVPTTVTTTISTVTVTSLTAVTSGAVQPLVPRQDLERTKPAYANYCANDAAYESACSCMGFTRTTTTRNQYTAYQLEIATVTALATLTVVTPPAATVTVFTKCS